MEIKSGIAVYQKLFSDKTALYSELFEKLTSDGEVLNRKVPGNREDKNGENLNYFGN